MFPCFHCLHDCMTCIMPWTRKSIAHLRKVLVAPGAPGPWASDGSRGLCPLHPVGPACVDACNMRADTSISHMCVFPHDAACHCAGILLRKGLQAAFGTPRSSISTEARHVNLKRMIMSPVHGETCMGLVDLSRSRLRCHALYTF